MRAVMGVGGFCADGGPYEIRQHCPQGTAGIMVGSIWGGLLLAGIYAWAVVKHHVPSFLGLLWPALFLSLGWNFFEFGIDPPGPPGGIVWGWLICGVVFAVMGGLPLLVVLPWLVRGFRHGRQERPGWPAGVPVGPASRIVARAHPHRSGDDSGLVSELERLDALRRSGALDDDEYRLAKERLLRGGNA